MLITERTTSSVSSGVSGWTLSRLEKTGALNRSALHIIIVMDKMFCPGRDNSLSRGEERGEVRQGCPGSYEHRLSQDPPFLQAAQIVEKDAGVAKDGINEDLFQGLVIFVLRHVQGQFAIFRVTESAPVAHE